MSTADSSRGGPRWRALLPPSCETSRPLGAGDTVRQREARHGMMMLVGLTAAAAGVLAVGLLHPGRDGAADPASARFATGPVVPPFAGGPDTAAPAPPPATVEVRATASTRPVAAAAARAAGTTPAAAAPGSAVDLVVGATVSLELDDRPGYRVRHRKFLARADRIEAGSSTLDRADSRFTVRAGLSGDGCVSLESVNYPQRYLRHRDFVIHLDRRADTALFAADATFCPAPRRGGTAVSLRSVNYPDRFVTLGNPALTLTTTATVFVVRPAL